MATVGSRPPERGRSITGKFGSTGAWLVTLALMTLIIISLAVVVTRGRTSPPSSDLPVVGNERAVEADALAAKPSPTLTPAPAVAAEVAAAALAENPVATASPMPTSLPLTAAAIQVEPDRPLAPAGPLARMTPMPMPTPRDVYSWTLEVPILMYHYISVPPEGADKYRLDLSTSPALFREQLIYLRDNGYETIDLYDLTLAIADKGDLPEKPMVITLDDGYRDNYEYAFPILQELGMTATFFVTTEFIDQNNPNYMDWAMVEEMAAAGMRIEPHSKTHPDLTVHDRDFVIWEVLGSQETIASHIGYRPRYFAYPGGRYDEQVLQIVAELDFWGAVTTSNGNWHGFNDRFEWGRVRMRNTTSPAELGQMIH